MSCLCFYSCGGCHARVFGCGGCRACGFVFVFLVTVVVVFLFLEMVVVVVVLVFCCCVGCRSCVFGDSVREPVIYVLAEFVR